LSKRGKENVMDLLQDLDYEMDEVKEILSQKRTERLEENGSKLAMLLDISKAINSILHLDELLKMVMDMVIKVTRAERGFLLLIDEQGQLQVETAYNLEGEKLRRDDFKVSKSIIDEVVKKGKSIWVTDVGRDEALQDRSSILELDLKSVMCVPLRVKGRPIGVIYVDSQSVTESFSQEDLVLFETLANHASISIQNAKLYRMAITDSMTGLYNHSYFHRRLEEELKRAKRYRSSFSLIMVDIDGLKRINDSFGHLEGDRILIGVASILKENVRAVDVTCRYGGDEFMIILPNTPREKAEKLGQRIEERVKEKLTRSDGKVITVSWGVSSYSALCSNKIELIDRADEEMYRMKREKGR